MYLQVELIGGLCNKLFCFFSAVDIAIKNGYILVEPNFGWKKTVCMSQVWNIKKLLHGVPELQWCSQESFKQTRDNIIYKSGAELWEYSETILKEQRNTCVLKRNEDMCCRILLALEPAECVMECYKHIIDTVTKCVGVHYRTESDWQAYSVKKQKRMPIGEHCWTDNNDICNMVINEFGTDKMIYVVSGEHGNDICKLLTNAGIKTYYNYDDNLEYEQNAAMHWYLCCIAQGGFVGLSRSTFSNLICLRRELTHIDGKCWIYNYWSVNDKKLQLRVDAGLQPEAYKCITQVTTII